MSEGRHILLGGIDDPNVDFSRIFGKPTVPVRELEAERDASDKAFRALKDQTAAADCERIDLRRERDAALSTIAKVEALHRRHPSYTDTPVCEHCKQVALGATIHAYWPCPTIRALGSVPSTGEGNDG